MALPERFLHHLQDKGYHPRSNKHSDALAHSIVEDLVAGCPSLANRAHEGAVVYDLNFDLRVSTATWNVNLVVGTPGQIVSPDGGLIARQRPATVQIAIEIKSVMTEHRKAVKNRKRDLEAHHEHVANYSDTAVSGGVFVVNHAMTFQSPLRNDITRHRTTKRDMDTLVEHCLNELRNVTERGDKAERGLDAKCALVVNMDNVRLAESRFVADIPAPQVGDPLHYDSFLQKICGLYIRRFS